MENSKSRRLMLVYMLMHGFFWCAYAVAWSYTAIYLSSCGYSNLVIGLVTGIGAVISVIMQPVFAMLSARFPALHTKNSLILLKILSLIFAAGIVCRLPGRATIAVLFTLIAAIDASVPSMLSSVAMDAINAGREINYGLARGTGSISYALFSMFLGYAVVWFGNGSLLVFYLITSGITIAISTFFPYEQKVREAKGTGGGMVSAIKKYPFLPYFLVASVFLFMGHNMVNIFLINIIRRAGGSSENLGLALAISAAVELPVMSLFLLLAKKLKVERMLVFSAVFFSLKSLTTLFALNLGLVYLAQFMQFGAFALFTPASVYFINKTMEPEDSKLGQALLGSCTLGLGGALGNVLGGVVIEAMGLNGMLVITTFLSVAGAWAMAVCMAVNKKANPVYPE